jgi:hypothetical protein
MAEAFSMFLPSVFGLRMSSVSALSSVFVPARVQRRSRP